MYSCLNLHKHNKSSQICISDIGTDKCVTNGKQNANTLKEGAEYFHLNQSSPT